MKLNVFFDKKDKMLEKYNKVWKKKSVIVLIVLAVFDS